MEWELTDEDVEERLDWEGSPVFSEGVFFGSREQAKKLVQHYEGKCEHDPAVNVMRWLCHKCRRELRCQVGLE